jgi:hypothetical protein
MLLGRHLFRLLPFAALAAAAVACASGDMYVDVGPGAVTTQNETNDSGVTLDAAPTGANLPPPSQRGRRIDDSVGRRLGQHDGRGLRPEHNRRGLGRAPSSAHRLGHQELLPRLRRAGDARELRLRPFPAHVRRQRLLRRLLLQAVRHVVREEAVELLTVTGNT